MTRPTIRTLFIAFCLAGATGCSDDPSNPMAPEAPDPDPTPVEGVLYVDTALGDDLNDGAAARPFKTITAGLAAADSSDTVKVRLGTYAEDEVFPIQLPEHVILARDVPAPRGDVRPRIEGSGAFVMGQFEVATLLGADGAEVHGFHVAGDEALGRGVGIHLAESGTMTIDIPAIMVALAELGFDGPVTLRPDVSQFGGARRDEIVRQCQASMDSLWSAAGLSKKGKLVRSTS